MPTDAKCGLLVGVGIVLAAAVFFFPKDPPPTPAVSPAAALKPPAMEPVRPERSPAPARPVARGVADALPDTRLP